MSNSFSYLIKYIIIGDTGVGKSSLLLQFMSGKFREGHEVTVGVEFGSKQVKIGQHEIKLQIWDTAGQEDFRSLTRSYYRQTAGAIVVYDITRKDTFENISRWVEEAKENGNKEMVFVLIGNKCDLEQERQVTFEEGQELALKNEMIFLETSAKNNEQVENIFTDSTLSIISKIESGQIDVNQAKYGIKTGSLVQKNANISLQENKKKTQGKSDSSCC